MKEMKGLRIGTVHYYVQVLSMCHNYIKYSLTRWQKKYIQYSKSVNTKFARSVVIYYALQCKNLRIYISGGKRTVISTESYQLAM